MRRVAPGLMAARMKPEAMGPAFRVPLIRVEAVWAEVPMAGDFAYTPRRHPGLALWKGNLLVFGLIFIFVAAYFFFQGARIRALFIEDAKEHARLVAGMVRLQAGFAIRSTEVIDETLSLFFENSARFVEYLESVEPFTEAELESFSGEAGLAGVAVIRADGTRNTGPAGWASDIGGCEEIHGLVRNGDLHEIRYGYHPPGKDMCIVTGIPASKIEGLREEIGLERVIGSISMLHGITFVRVENPGLIGPGLTPGAMSTGDVVGASIVEHQGNPVVEVRVAIGEGTLVVGLDAVPLRQRGKGLWHDFAALSLLLAVSAGFLSWILFRQQERHLSQVEDYERRLSRRREEAALGRAAASIAHEVRNPLNAISMGLQRLLHEGAGLNPSNRRIIEVTLDSLKRTNVIISGLLDYARPVQIRQGIVSLDAIVEDTLVLLTQTIKEKGITLKKDTRQVRDIPGDPVLLGQVVMNLVKNALEAERQGGKISVFVGENQAGVGLRVENGGDVPSSEDVLHVFEPYFTTKTRGIGLGLSISRKIVSSHGGTIEASITKDGTFLVTMSLPRDKGTGKTFEVESSP